MATEHEVRLLIDRFEKAVVDHERCGKHKRNSVGSRLSEKDAHREYEAARAALVKALRRS
jgi:hypothetical protein